MELRMPKKGETYRHFKGNLYRVLAIAMHTETEEMMVVYQEHDGENVYARPLGMFLSKVNKEKYPEVSQEYRFELVSDKPQSEVQTEDEILSESIDCSMIMEFLDISEVSGKIRYLELRKNSIDDNFIEMVAQSLDFTENDGTLEERYRALLQYLRTVEKYERSRRLT